MRSMFLLDMDVAHHETQSKERSMLCLIVLWLERRNFSWVDYGSRKILSLSGYTRSREKCSAVLKQL